MHDCLLLPAPRNGGRKSTGADIHSWEGGAANQGEGMYLVNTAIDRFFYFYSVQFIPYNLNKEHGIWACNPGNPYYIGFLANHSSVKVKICHRDEKFLEGHVPLNYSNILILSHLDIVLWLHFLHAVVQKDQIHSISAGRTDRHYLSGSASLQTDLNKSSDLCLANHSSIAMESCYRALERPLGELLGNQQVSEIDRNHPFSLFLKYAFLKRKYRKGTVLQAAWLVSPHLGEALPTPACFIAT